MSKKIAIISNYGRALAPYIEFYADLCKKNHVDYVVINKEEEPSQKADQEAFVLDKDMMKVGAIGRTWKWYRFVVSQIRKHKCNKFVVLPTRTAIILFPFLFFKKGKYIFDIRDYTKENNKLYKKLEDILIQKSYMTTISSPGFREWLLPSEKIHHIHNMPYEENVEEKAKDLNKEVVSLGFLGVMTASDQEYNQKMLQNLPEKTKYTFTYRGIIPAEFETFCKENAEKNLVCGGRYCDSKKTELYAKVDIINSVYGVERRTALPNRLYDALLYKKPMVVSKGTFLASLVEKYHIGFAIDPAKENLAEKLEEFIQGYTPEGYSKNCEIMLSQIKKEQEKTVKKMVAFFKK